MGFNPQMGVPGMGGNFGGFNRGGGMGGMNNMRGGMGNRGRGGMGMGGMSPNMPMGMGGMGMGMGMGMMGGGMPGMGMLGGGSIHSSPAKPPTYPRGDPRSSSVSHYFVSLYFANTSFSQQAATTSVGVVVTLIRPSLAAIRAVGTREAEVET